MVEADLSSDDSNNEKVQIFGGNNCGNVEGFFLNFLGLEMGFFKFLGNSREFFNFLV